MYERRLFNISGRKWMIMNGEWNCQEGEEDLPGIASIIIII
jgi:hypothetical protein